MRRPFAAQTATAPLRLLAAVAAPVMTESREQVIARAVVSFMDGRHLDPNDELRVGSLARHVDHELTCWESENGR